MPRALAIRKPTPTEIRELNKLLEEELKPRQRRRAEAILLYATDMTAIDIARFLNAHVNSIVNNHTILWLSSCKTPISGRLSP
jgi:hypothetical protein